jgi:hypothetical protein
MGKLILLAIGAVAGVAAAVYAAARAELEGGRPPGTLDAPASPEAGQR